MQFEDFLYESSDPLSLASTAKETDSTIKEVISIFKAAKFEIGKAHDSSAMREQVFTDKARNKEFSLSWWHGKGRFGTNTAVLTSYQGAVGQSYKHPTDLFTAADKFEDAAQKAAYLKSLKDLVTRAKAFSK